MSSPVVGWDPTAGRQVDASLRVAMLSAGGPYVTASRNAALQFALQAAFAGEKAICAAGLVPWPSSAFVEQAAFDVAVPFPPPIVGPGPIVLGQNTGVALEALRGIPSSLPAGSVTPDRWQAVGAALHYLAIQRSIRALVQTSRPWAGPLDVDVVGPGLGAIPLGIVIAVTCVASVGIAALAWYERETEVEAKRSDVALLEKQAEQAAQVKLAADLAAAALSRGQAVDIPEIVRSLASQEAREDRTLPIVGGLLLGGLLVGGGVAAMRGRPLVKEGGTA